MVGDWLFIQIVRSTVKFMEPHHFERDAELWHNFCSSYAPPVENNYECKFNRVFLNSKTFSYFWLE